MATLWGDDPPSSAAGSLQVYVHGLRRALGAARIETHGTAYRILVDDLELDLARFEHLVERARRAMAASLAGEANEDLGAALALWNGSALADVAGEGLLAIEAGRLEDARVTAIELHNDTELALGAHDELAARLPLLIAAEPYRERLREQHMLALYRAGRQQEALEAYRSARRTLREELGVEPGPALRELERAVLRHDDALAAPPMRHRAGGALPIPGTPLVGRYLEVAAVTALLQREDVRLVTLTGPGGSGKTRIALAVAEQLAGELRDGAVFVDLSSVTEGALLLPTIGQALDAQDRAQTVETAVADDLRGRSGLLVLDNFEQLLDCASLVGELIAGAPRLRVLVTSRAPLRLSWEREYPVPPLRPPEHREGISLAELNGNDAIRLFTARATAVDPAFELGERSAAAVAEICRRLDGLPLAIELAAARSKVLPPETMAQHLGQVLPLLTGGAVDLPERQRTLQATLDWSYALLGERERLLLARLAVFAGGFAFESVAAVCPDLEDEPLSLLATLVDHSLLRREDACGGTPRFGMLDTIREYALGRLEASGEDASARARHAAHFAALAEHAESEIAAGADPAPLLARLESEHDNLRAALAHLHEWGSVEAELRLASSLAYFWRVRAHLSEGRVWLEGALARAGDVSPELRAKSLSSAGRLAYRQGDYARARNLHEQALLVSRDSGDLRAVGQALSDLGGVSLGEGDVDRATALYMESAEVLRTAGHRVRLGTVLGNLADINLGRGEPVRARRLAEDALAIQEDTGDKEGRVFTYLNLGRIAVAERRPDEAVEAFGHSLRLIEELDYREVIGTWFLCCAELAWRQRELSLAARLLDAADAGYERAGVGRLRTDDRELRAEILDAAVLELGPEGLQRALLDGRNLSAREALDLVARRLDHPESV